VGSSSSAARRLKVSAIEQPTTYSQSEQPEQQQAAVAGAAADPELEQQLAVQQLDEAQENLLKWMLFLDSDAQDADLDEMEDVDEVGDAEFAGLYDEVETMLEESEASVKVGDKVYGTVYEVDEDGAYVEIGAKSAGFVPLVECSLGKLKTVRYRWGGRPRDWALIGAPDCPATASPRPLPARPQPLEVLRPGMKREFVVAEDEDEYGEVILSLAAMEVRANRAAPRRARGPPPQLAAQTGRQPCHVPMVTRAGVGGCAQLGSSPSPRGPPSANRMCSRPARCPARLPPPPAQAQTFWQRIRQMQEEDVPVTVTVAAVNRGGLMVQYAHLEGFIPVSQLGQVGTEAQQLAHGGKGHWGSPARLCHRLMRRGGVVLEAGPAKAAAAGDGVGASGSSGAANSRQRQWQRCQQWCCGQRQQGQRPLHGCSCRL
jgi:hypothetical protein